MFKKVFRIFLVMFVVLSQITYVLALSDNEKENILNRDENTLTTTKDVDESTNDSFELLGKTFQGTSTGSLIVKFYSKKYNSVQDTCMEINDRGHISYIYFSYSMYNKDTCTLMQYTSAVTGYWSSYAPLQINCVWNGDYLTVQVTMSNGMALVSSNDCKLIGSISPIDPEEPDDNKNAEIRLNSANIVVGESGFLEGTYIPKSPSNISAELNSNSLKWSIENDSIVEIKHISYAIASDKKSANIKIEIAGKKCGVTSIIGNLSAVGGENSATTINVEPKLILPKTNAAFINDYDCNIKIFGEDYICITVNLEESNEDYLEKFLNSIKCDISKNPNSSENNIAKISNTGYKIMDDGKTGQYIIPIDPNNTNIDNIISIKTAAQNKSIRVIYDSPYSDIDDDGIPDEWEKNGLDTDKDGIIDVDLKAMGAVVGQRDLFVEIDIMDKLKISQKSLDIVAEQFKKHNIYLHIDAGPDSVDYVTGKKWGLLSKSDRIPYSKKTTLYDFHADENGYEEIDNYNAWDELTNKYFSNERRSVFRHCMFINSFDTKRTSGMSRGCPAQSFVITSHGVGNIDDDNTRAIAGTFMHELGHTLGLKHGGSDYCNFKPNDLSIMNYLYQFSGLYGTDEINYSEYVLPEINENGVDESKGIDPKGVISNPNLGAKWILNNEEEYYSKSISGKSIDFNKDGKIEVLTNIDFYHGSEDYSVNTASINEWDALIFRGGSIGDLGATSPLNKITTDKDKVIIENISVDEAKKLGIYENDYDENDTHNIVKINKKEPTCDENGNIEYYVCSHCNKLFYDTNCLFEITEFDTIIPALGHNFGEWNITKEPTCTEKGEKTRYCSRCDKVLVESIDLIDHNYSEWKTVKEASCTEEGKQERKCSMCGKTEIKSISALGHDFGEWIIAKEPTCTEKGEKTKDCSRCDKVLVESIDLIDHNYSEWKLVKEASCTEEGKQERKCSMCGKTETKSMLALGHDFGEWTVIKEPTESESGYKERICIVCNKKETKKIDTLDKFSAKNENVKTGDTLNSNYYVLFLFISATSLMILFQRKKVI